MSIVNLCFGLLRSGNQQMFSHLFRFEMKRQCQFRGVRSVHNHATKKTKTTWIFFEFVN